MRIVVVIAFLVCMGACSSGEQADQSLDAESQRARDSTIAESALPGAAGVRGAMGAADSAAARRARIDSLAETP